MERSSKAVIKIARRGEVDKITAETGVYSKVPSAKPYMSNITESDSGILKAHLDELRKAWDQAPSEQAIEEAYNRNMAMFRKIKLDIETKGVSNSTHDILLRNNEEDITNEKKRFDDAGSNKRRLEYLLLVYSTWISLIENAMKTSEMFFRLA